MNAEQARQMSEQAGKNPLVLFVEKKIEREAMQGFHAIIHPLDGFMFELTEDQIESLYRELKKNGFGVHHKVHMKKEKYTEITW